MGSQKTSSREPRSLTKMSRHCYFLPAPYSHRISKKLLLSKPVVPPNSQKNVSPQPRRLIRSSKKLLLANPVISPKSQKDSSHQPSSPTKITKNCFPTPQSHQT